MAETNMADDSFEPVPEPAPAEAPAAPAEAAEAAASEAPPAEAPRQKRSRWGGKKEEDTEAAAAASAAADASEQKKRSRWGSKPVESQDPLQLAVLLGIPLAALQQMSAEQQASLPRLKQQVRFQPAASGPSASRAAHRSQLTLRLARCRQHRHRAASYPRSHRFAAAPRPPRRWTRSTCCCGYPTAVPATFQRATARRSQSPSSTAAARSSIRVGRGCARSSSCRDSSSSPRSSQRRASFPPAARALATGVPERWLARPALTRALPPARDAAAGAAAVLAQAHRAGRQVPRLQLLRRSVRSARQQPQAHGERVGLQDCRAWDGGYQGGACALGRDSAHMAPAQCLSASPGLRGCSRRGPLPLPSLARPHACPSPYPSLPPLTPTPAPAQGCRRHDGKPLGPEDEEPMHVLIEGPDEETVERGQVRDTAGAAVGENVVLRPARPDVAEPNTPTHGPQALISQDLRCG